MIRLTDVDNLIDFLTRPTGQFATCEKCYNTDCVDCIREEVIKNLPIIEAEPVRYTPNGFYCKFYFQRESDL